MIAAISCNFWLVLLLTFDAERSGWLDCPQYLQEDDLYQSEMEPSPNRCSYKTFLHIGPCVHCGREGKIEEGMEILKSQRVREFTLRLCLLLLRSYINKDPITWIFKCELNKDDMSKHVKLIRGNPTRPNPEQKTTGNWVKLSVGEAICPKGRWHQLVVQCQTLSPENIIASNII